MKPYIIINPVAGSAGDIYNVVVANGRFGGGGFPLAPQANFSDGLLDIVLVPKRPAAKMALLAAEMLWANTLQRFRYFSASKKDISPVAAEDVVQCGWRTGRK